MCVSVYYIHTKLCSRAETFLRFRPLYSLIPLSLSLSPPFLLCAKLLTVLRTVEISRVHSCSRFCSSNFLIVVLFFGWMYGYNIWLQCALCFPLRKTALTWSAAHCKHILLVSLHITTPTIQSWLLFYSLEFSSIQLMVRILSCWKFCVYVYLLCALLSMCIPYMMSCTRKSANEKQTVLFHLFTFLYSPRSLSSHLCRLTF